MVAPSVKEKEGAIRFMSSPILEYAISMTLLFVIVGLDFKIVRSGSVHDMISASALGASS